MPTVETDVLVIGGGLAALRAALSAADTARVTVAVKGKAARSGSSAMTTAGYAAPIPPDLTAEVHYRDTMEGGYHLNDPALVQILIDESYARLQELEGFGATLLRDDDGKLALSPSGDHSESRVVSPVHRIGTDFTLPLAERARDRDVGVLENQAALDLIVSDGAVTGALLLDTRSGELTTVRAGAVVLASGGAGRLFEITSNPAGTTGDGYAMALRAGARLRDMEMIQFYPWRCIDPFDRSRMPIQPSTFVVGGKLFNRLGERFMAEYNPDPERMEASTRDVGARAIYDQIQKGLGIGGGVRLDLSALDRDTFERTNYKVWRGLASTDIDYRTYPFILTPEAHYVMGGIAIDGEGATDVPGLFAAGEVAGGIQGANRLNSNALPETQVFGHRAGTSAAAHARAHRTRTEGDAPATPIPGGLTRERGSRLKLDREELQSVAWSTLGIVREEASLQRGLAHVRALAGAVAAFAPRTVKEAVDWLELRNLCAFAEVSYLSALHRTESRGAHHRSDYPQQDDANWRKAVVVTMPRLGTVEITTSPVAMARRTRVGSA